MPPPVFLIALLFCWTGSGANPEVFRALNQTLCSDKCTSGCKVYRSPLGCYSPSKLWPGDPQWGKEDILDSLSPLGLSVNRTFFFSTGGSCDRADGSSTELPTHECIGPFGKPRPWGELRPVQ
jgi:hypothetical protein